MKKRFLVVTANENETAALLEEKDCFMYESDKRSDNPDDDTFYNVGHFGVYEAVHFELQEQGSAKAAASLASIHMAIDAWKPDAVILVGIAFGKDNEKKQGERQHIGDVLVSTMIADYESGKQKEGSVQSDGAMPEAGKTLLSVFRHYSKSWVHMINERRANCYFGALLSGDKVVDDSEFKKSLFERYPRAIGGEMEGRGAYSACRIKRLDEWIVVKAICDWGENKGNPNKKQDQITASKSVVSLLRHIFMNDRAFDKLPSRAVSQQKESEMEEVKPTPQNKMHDTDCEEESPLGYFISIGTTSCRLFQVQDKQTLIERAIVSYDISDIKDEGYLPGIIEHVRKVILPKIERNPARLFAKVFVDYNFVDVFEQQEELTAKDDFLLEFYEKTGLCLNLLTKAQTIENLKRLFGPVPANTAIIIINAECVDVLVYSGSEFNMCSIAITLADICALVDQKNFDEVWDDNVIAEIKRFVTKKIGKKLDGVFFDAAIIIKNELKFMQMMGYPLRLREGQLCLTRTEYRKANHELIFKIDLKEKLKQYNNDETVVKRLYAFRYGHIILETILEKVNCKTVIPKNDHSIHGSGFDTYKSYIFNVVISGSTHDGRASYMSNARDLLQKMGANVLSPYFDSNGNLEEITPHTEIRHLKAIRECDMLFICNNGENGYIGEATKCEIYYAYALNKAIAFWREPPVDKRISFIPQEWWGSIMALED